MIANRKKLLKEEIKNKKISNLTLYRQLNRQNIEAHYDLGKPTNGSELVNFLNKNDNYKSDIALLKQKIKQFEKEKIL